VKSVPLSHAAEVVLGRQRAPQYEEGEGQTPYLRSANIKDGRLDLSDVKSMRFSLGERMRYELRAGDVLVTEGSGSRDSVGASAVWLDELPGQVCFQNTLLRLRPRAGVSGRYLGWWARYAHASGLVQDVASGANILHVGAEAMRSLPLALPEFEEQQRIADFLDDQVACLDSASWDAQRAGCLVAGRFQANVDAIFAGSAQTVPLKALLMRFPQYGVLVPKLMDTGVPFIRIRDLSQLAGREAASLAAIPAAQSLEFRRTVVAAGDVVVGVVGSTDKAALVPMQLAGANIARAVARLVPRPGVPSDVLLGWLSTTAYRRQVAAVTDADTAQPTLNMSELRNFRVALPDRSLPALAASVQDAREERRSLATRTNTLVHLLHERRKALITACVTGEFDVSTASLRARGAAP